MDVREILCDPKDESQSPRCFIDDKRNMLLVRKLRIQDNPKILHVVHSFDRRSKEAVGKNNRLFLSSESYDRALCRIHNHTVHATPIGEAIELMLQVKAVIKLNDFQEHFEVVCERQPRAFDDIVYVIEVD